MSYPADAPAARRVGSGPAWVLGLLLAATILNFIDRKLPQILIEPIKHDLHLSDTALGALNGLGFTAVYAVAGLVFGRLADRLSRKWIIVGCVAVWSVFTALGGVSRSYGELMATRMGVAAAEAGATPASNALVSDLYPPHRRAFALSLLVSGGAFGSMAGLMLGGWLDTIVGWRGAMFAVLVPGLVIAVLIAATVREPARIVTAGIVSTAASIPDEGLATFWRRRTLRYLLVGTALFSAVGTGTTSFLPAFLIRYRGLTTMQVGSGFGLAMGVAGGLGILLGGLLGDKAAARDPRWMLWAPALGAIGIIPLLSAGILSPDPWIGMALMAAGFTLSGLYYGPAFAIIQTLGPAGQRAFSAAVMYVAITGVGQSVGPLIVGMISDALAPRVGAASLLYALLSVQACLVLGAIAYAAASRHIGADWSRFADGDPRR